MLYTVKGMLMQAYVANSVYYHYAHSHELYSTVKYAYAALSL